MAVRQPPRKRQPVKPRQTQQRPYQAAPKRKAKVPWWGWCLIAIVAMKGCGEADAIYAEHTGSPPPPATTTPGGQ